MPLIVQVDKQVRLTVHLECCRIDLLNILKLVFEQFVSVVHFLHSMEVEVKILEILSISLAPGPTGFPTHLLTIHHERVEECHKGNDDHLVHFSRRFKRKQSRELLKG
jgi:hypothetical protein